MNSEVILQPGYTKSCTTVHNVGSEIDFLNLRIGALSNQLTQVGNEAHRHRKQAESAKHEVEELVRRIRLLEDQLAAVNASKSWRWTHRLRMMGSSLRCAKDIVRRGFRRILGR